MEIHYQTSKQKAYDGGSPGAGGPPETPKMTTGHGGRLEAVSIASLNKKIADDPKVAMVCKIMEQHVTINRKNNIAHAARQVDAFRARALGDYERKDPLNAARIVVEPKYELNERLNIHVEYCEPPHEIFMALGYNKDHEDGNKQYRKYFDNSIEDNKDIMPRKPFDTYVIKRG